MKRIWALVPLATALTLSACKKQESPAFEEVRPVQVMVTGRSEDVPSARYSGEIVARHESLLGFRVSGKVVTRLVDVGAQVRRGQPLMRLSQEQEALSVAGTAADVEAARSRVAQALVDVERTERLLTRQFASRDELDQQRLQLQQAQAQLKSALARNQATIEQQGYTVLSSDRDGVVAAISADVGQVVQAGQPVLTVDADGEREVAISIPESRLDEVKHAHRLQISAWAHPEEVWSGTLRELAPATDNLTRTYAARISIQHPDTSLLHLGMTASVLMLGDEDMRRIRLPLTAILDQEGQHQVWVVDPKTSRVALRAVTLGEAQENGVAVLSGLAVGEAVVTAGVHMLHAGQAVQVPGSEVRATNAPSTVTGGAK